MMNGRQRCGQGIVNHESGRTTRKKSAKVAVGKSTGEEAYGGVPRAKRLRIRVARIRPCGFRPCEEALDGRALLDGRLGVVLRRGGWEARDGRDRIVAARVEQGVL